MDDGLGELYRFGMGLLGCYGVIRSWRLVKQLVMGGLH